MLKYIISIISLLVILAVSILAVGCSQSSTTAPSTAPTPPTAGEVAAAGEPVFASHCASCHGATGGGGRAPAIIGASAHLGKYNTAQGLLDYVSTAMPANTPGSLSHQEYLNVVSYLIVQNNYMSPDASFVGSQLSNVSLK
jgi:mono/diheme cytochrome c family protein